MQMNNYPKGRFMKIRFFLVIALSIGIAGCVSGYKQFYTALPGVTPEVVAERRASPPPENPKLERTAPADQESILAAYAQRGYVMIGSSFFNSGRPESESLAIQQAKGVKADLVLVINPQYTGSVTTAVPFTTPTTNTAQTNTTANIYGTNGNATVNATSTTTSYGSKTTYIPVTQHRTDYGAIYFIKIPFTFGLFVRNLNDTERALLQTNQGVAVLTVVEDTPAFFSDILPNDIILSINKNATSTEDRFSYLVNTYRGQTVEVKVHRNGKSFLKNVTLNK
jgi:hypothetical protein